MTSFVSYCLFLPLLLFFFFDLNQSLLNVLKISTKRCNNPSSQLSQSHHPCLAPSSPHLPLLLSPRTARSLRRVLLSHYTKSPTNNTTNPRSSKTLFSTLLPLTTPQRCPKRLQTDSAHTITLPLQFSLPNNFTKQLGG